MVQRRVKSIRQEILRQDKILRSEVAKELHDSAFAVAAILTASVATWKKKPKFSPEIRIERDALIADVLVTGKTDIKNIFHWVDKGTGKFGPKKQSYKIPSVVTPDSKPLTFRTGYKPRTRAIAKANVGPGRATGPWRSAKQVTHPGIKARRFTETIEDVLRPDFKRRMENAFKRASRRITR